MLTKTDIIITVNALINLVLAVSTTILNYAKPPPKTTFLLTKALARSKKFINFNCNVCSAFYALFSILWVFTKPATDEQESTIETYDSNKNDTFSVFYKNYYCVSLRATNKYFLYLANHWLLCEVIQLVFTTVNVFSKFDFGKKYAIIAYAIFTIPTALYINLTRETERCWASSELNIVSFARTIVWLALVFIVLAMFIAVACLQRKELATKGPRKSPQKIVWLVVEMGFLSGLLLSLHLLQLKTTLMTMEEYESFVGLGTVATNFLWTVFSTWNDVICFAIRSGTQRAFNREENIELNGRLIKAKGKQVVAAANVDETEV